MNNARQWQRFAFPADVQLAVSPSALGSAAAVSPQARVTTAACVDLSLGGVQLITTANALTVGAAVSCGLPGNAGGQAGHAGDGELHLPGYVRWLMPDARHGTQGRCRIGIEFEPLSTHTRQSLQALLSQVQRAGEIMRVHLPSFTHPLLGVAVTGERGVHLHVPLPFFVSGSVVRFEPVHGGPAFEGRVLGSQLGACPETQALELDLLLEPCQPARQRRYMVYENPDYPSSQNLGAPSEAAGTLSVPKTLTNRVLAGGAVLGCLIWLGLTVSQELASRRASEARTAAQPTHLPQRKRVRDNGTPVPAPARTTRPTSDGWLAEGRPTLAPVAPQPTTAPQPTAALTATPQPTTAPQPTAALTATPPGPSTASQPPAAPQTSEAPSPAPDARSSAYSALLQPSATVAVPQPRFTSSEDSSEIFVPVSGSLLGLRTALWVDPPAVVVEVPSGEVPVAQTRYELRSGGIQRLTISKPRGLTQVRVFLSVPVTRFNVEESTGGLTIKLKRDPQAAPF